MKLTCLRYGCYAPRQRIVVATFLPLQVSLEQGFVFAPMVEEWIWPNRDYFNEPHSDYSLTSKEHSCITLLFCGPSALRILQ